MSDLEIRAGDARDAGIVLAMFDEAIPWLVARGSEGQWGSEPFTGNPAREEMARNRAGAGGLRIALVDGEPAGALSVNETKPEHVPPAGERELYIDLLLTRRVFAGRGVGSALLDRARDEARERGIGLLRVDCWAGGDGRLVRYYQGQGFNPTVRFEVKNGWIGQVFEQRLD